jgi:hypothetical protein
MYGYTATLRIPVRIGRIRAQTRSAGVSGSHGGVDAPAAAFAARKPNTVIYLPDGVGRYADELEHLGPPTTGVGCLYLGPRFG